MSLSFNNFIHEIKTNQWNNEINFHSLWKFSLLLLCIYFTSVSNECSLDRDLQTKFFDKPLKLERIFPSNEINMRIDFEPLIALY